MRQQIKFGCFFLLILIVFFAGSCDEDDQDHTTANQVAEDLKNRVGTAADGVTPEVRTAGSQTGSFGVACVDNDGESGESSIKGTAITGKKAGSAATEVHSSTCDPNKSWPNRYYGTCVDYCSENGNLIEYDCTSVDMECTGCINPSVAIVKQEISCACSNGACQ